MILRIILIVACLQATILLAQTEEQKQFMFERINHDAKGNVVLPKTESFTNKEDLFKKAVILPVFKVVFDKENKPKLIQNKNYFLVSYIGRLYAFLDKTDSRFLENSPIIQNIAKYNLEKKKFNVVYFTENFSLHSKYLNPLLTDEKLSFIIDKNLQYRFSEYIEYAYGSMEKYKEKYLLDAKRDKLTSKDYKQYLSTYYPAFENSCSKDTTQVLKAFMGQIKSATKGFTHNQEIELLERVKQKINPLEFRLQQLKESLIKGKVSDSIISKSLYEAKIEGQKEKKVITEKGIYDFVIYGVNINNELLDVLTNKQFLDYKNYIDLMNPIIETLNVNYNNKFRYNYGTVILEKEGIIKPYDTNAVKEYIKKIIEGCGCHSDN